MKKERKWEITIRQSGDLEGHIANENIENDYEKTMEMWNALKNGDLDSRAKKMSCDQSHSVMLTMELTTWVTEYDENGLDWDSDIDMVDFFNSETYEHGEKCSSEEEEDEDYERSWGGREDD